MSSSETIKPDFYQFLLSLDVKPFKTLSDRVNPRFSPEELYCIPKFRDIVSAVRAKDGTRAFRKPIPYMYNENAQATVLRRRYKNSISSRRTAQY